MPDQVTPLPVAEALERARSALLFLNHRWDYDAEYAVANAHAIETLRLLGEFWEDQALTDKFLLASGRSLLAAEETEESDE